MRGKLNARDHVGQWPGVKDGAAEAPMRKLAGGPRNSDALDNWKRLFDCGGGRKCFKTGAECTRIALKRVRSDGLARLYA